ncbi:hypothetical protein ACJX0J_017967, partial [Zea mays]
YMAIYELTGPPYLLRAIMPEYQICLCVETKGTLDVNGQSVLSIFNHYFFYFIFFICVHVFAFCAYANSCGVCHIALGIISQFTFVG